MLLFFNRQLASMARLNMPLAKGLRILAVDPNETNRVILLEGLGGWGAEASVVAGAPEAFLCLEEARLQGRPFSVVILDRKLLDPDGAVAARLHELADHVLAMVSTAERSEDIGRLTQLGIHSYLMKPIRRRDLLDGLKRALAPPGALVDWAEPTRAGGFGRSTRCLRLLLAEDNPINRKLTVRLLEKRGHQVDAVENGEQAVAALERGTYDAVLMDMEMPVMDGVQAARTIRGLEKASGRHMPIIAMTAHALKGDRERYLAAGMDGYISKPLSPGDLFTVVEALARPATAEPAVLHTEAISTAPAAPAGGGEGAVQAPPIFDRAGALVRAGGSEPLLGEMIALFLEECPRLMGKIQAALEAREPEELEQAAHALGGAALTLGALSASKALARLETIGRERELALGAEAWEELKDAIAELKPVLFRTERDRNGGSDGI
jgi:CheY-like chemotaxis protein